MREPLNIINNTMEVLELIRTDFDNSENVALPNDVSIGLFKDNNAIRKYLGDIIVRPYTGYDGNIYPTFKIVTRKVNEKE